jgi:hypothetical protein
MSDKNLEQWINIKFCVKIGKSAGETLALLTLAYGEYAMKKSSVFERHRWFKEEQDDVLVVQDHACVSSITRGQSTMNSLHKDKR